MNLGEIGMNSLLWSPMNGKSWPKFKEKEEEGEEEEGEEGGGIRKLKACFAGMEKSRR